MKKIALIVILSVVALGLRAEGGVDSRALWERAGRLYTAGDYNGAAATYDSIVNEGLESAELYYNLGCSYFKAGKSGRAILNYHRAQRLAPADGDIAYNLAYAESFVKDKIDEVPEFATTRLLGSAKNLVSVDCWGVLSLVMLALALIAILFYLLSQRRAIRKAGFVVGIVATFLLLCTVGLGASARRTLLSEDEAIVLSTAAVVKASPERTGKDLFILHEGTKVEVLDSFGEWSEIRIADGNEGWIRSSSIEII